MAKLNIVLRQLYDGQQQAKVTYMHTHTYTYTHTCMNKHTSTYTHTYIHTHTYTHIHTNTRTHTNTHAYMHTHTYTNTHTYTLSIIFRVFEYLVQRKCDVNTYAVRISSYCVNSMCSYMIITVP